MKAKLKIKEAIKYYNENKAEGVANLTSSALALKVFAGQKAGNDSKIVRFYRLTNNHRKFIDTNLLIKISEITGYPVENLIEYKH